MPVQSKPYAIETTARSTPDKPAAVNGASGAVLTFGQLEERSQRISALLHDLGLVAGDRVALLMDNTERYFEFVWAARRSGLLLVPVNWHLTVDEASYIVSDSGAQVVFASPEAAPNGLHSFGMDALRGRFSVGGDIDGFVDLEHALGDLDPGVAPMPEIDGATMFYSSGTTGRPKGIVRTLSGEPYGRSSTFPADMQERFEFAADMTYLCPAPLYHAGPLGWSFATQAVGGTVIVMPRFDASEALRLIQEHRVTHAQFVPTMFHRMLRLPDAERQRYDTSSLRMAAHAAAPCPVDVKRAMLDWWGDVIWEFYGGSESNGGCMVGPREWRERPGTVGRATFGEVRILDDEDRELPAGEIGTVYFSGTPRFDYHNDPDKTDAAFSRQGWSTLGDLGHVDNEGYLFLSERRTNLIICGGVNIYPQEIENVLAAHPAVDDVAVIGIPDSEMGQVVRAVVQPVDMNEAGEELAAALIDWCRAHLARFKCPRAIDFDAQLPRMPTGKLLKRQIMNRYLASPAGPAV